MIMNSSELQKALLQNFTPFMEEMGYKYLKRRSAFIKRTPGVTYVVFLEKSFVGFDWWLDCVIAVRIDAVEKVWDKIDQRELDMDSLTYAESVYFMNRNLCGKYMCKTDAEIYDTIPFLLRFLMENLKHIEVDWIDMNWLNELYNNPDNRRLINHRLLPMDRILGLIFSKFSKQGDFEDLVAKYDEELRFGLTWHVQVENYYPDKFNRLVNYLRLLS